MKKSDINWLLELAISVSKKSKDPSTKVGCVIVHSDLTPASFGLNGFVKKSDETLLTYNKPMKHKTILHAEENAVILAKKDLSNCIAAVTHAPCPHCLLVLCQAGIKKIYFNEIGPIANYDDLDLNAHLMILKSNKDVIVENKDNESLSEIIELILEKRRI